MTLYQRNNILFRIASSNAISKFKAIQAHTFIQAARGDNAFDTSSKEVVLLEYDRITQWLLKVEKILISCEGDYVDKSIKSTIVDSFRDEILTIENVIDSHSTVFCACISDFIKTVHSYSANIICQHILESFDQKIDRAFEYISEIMTDYLQHILLCMHEFTNNLVGRKHRPFISISDSCIRLFSKMTTENGHILKRATFFARCSGNSTFAFKNYSKGHDLYEQLYKSLYSISIELSGYLVEPCIPEQEIKEIV